MRPALPQIWRAKAGVAGEGVGCASAFPTAITRPSRWSPVCVSLASWPRRLLVFGMMLFACFIPFQSVLIPMATILGKLGGIGQTLTDTTGLSFGFGNPTVNLVLVHVVYGLGFTTRAVQRSQLSPICN